MDDHQEAEGFECEELVPESLVQEKLGEGSEHSGGEGVEERALPDHYLFYFLIQNEVENRAFEENPVSVEEDLDVEEVLFRGKLLLEVALGNFGADVLGHLADVSEGLVR